MPSQTASLPLDEAVIEGPVLSPSSPLLLGSGSPRRREILSTLGLPFRVQVASVDETRLPAEGPEAYLQRVVDAKRQAVAPALEAAEALASLVADTSVIVEGEVLGKPVDRADAEAMLGRLSGRWHEVHTRFALSPRASTGLPPLARTVVTRVRFRPLSSTEIAGYAASGEGLDKAGAYAVQGLGAFAVAALEGSYTNVVGLPACELVEALLELQLLPSFPLEGTGTR